MKKKHLEQIGTDRGKDKCALLAALWPELINCFAEINAIELNHGIVDFRLLDEKIDYLDSAVSALICQFIGLNQYNWFKWQESGLDLEDLHLWQKSGLEMGEFINFFEKVLTKLRADYPKTVAVAKEFDHNVVIKSMKDIEDGLMELGAEELRKIQNFTKPELLIVPKNSFKEKVKAMDKHKHLDIQGDVYVRADFEKYVENPTATMISVVEGEVNLPAIPGQDRSIRHHQIANLLVKYFSEKGLEAISAHEYLVLMQKSLKENATKGMKYETILDSFHTNGSHTRTWIRGGLGLNLMLFGMFGNEDNDVMLAYYKVNAMPIHTLRWRPSIKVMEY